MVSRAFEFLELPPEIRNLIYRYTFTVKHHKFGYVELAKRPKHKNNRTTSSALALLQTCTQIYDEAACLFYELNRIAIGYLQVNSFLKTVRTTRLSSTERFIILDRNYAIGSFRFIDNLRNLLNLESLTVILFPEQIHFPSLKPRTAYTTRITKLIEGPTMLRSLREVRVTPLTRRHHGWHPSDFPLADVHTELAIKRCGGQADAGQVVLKE